MTFLSKNWTGSGGPKVEKCDLAYSVMDAPIRRDLIREICHAARKRGIAIDLYFSHCDWFDADFRGDPDHTFHDKNFSKRSDPEGYARMVKRHRGQIRELLTNYGKIDMMCLDQNHLPGMEWRDMKETIKMACRLQRDVLFRMRGIGAYGDYQTPENWIPTSGGETDRRVVKPWMVIHTLSGQFAFDRRGERYRPGPWIVEQLIDICSKGGNFMVSIGPDEQGEFHPTAVKHLEYAGDWLRVNGEAIYGTRPWVKYREGDAIRFTRGKDKKSIYAISLKWPGRSLILKSISPRKGSRIFLLGWKEPLGWRLGQGKELIIEIPESLQDEKNRPCRQAYAFKIEI